MPNRAGAASVAERRSGQMAYEIAMPASAATIVGALRGMRESASAARMVPQPRLTLKSVSVTRKSVPSVGLARTLCHSSIATAPHAAAAHEQPASESALGHRRATMATGT